MLRASLPGKRRATGCGAVTPNNGVGRTICGWLFDATGPSPFTTTRQDSGHWNGLAAQLNDDPLGKTRTSIFPYIKVAHSEVWSLVQPLVSGIAAGYMQAGVSWGDIDSIPRFGFYNQAGDRVEVDFDGYSASLGNTLVRFNALGVASQGQQMLDSGGAVVAIEIRPSDRFVTGWSDPGGDPRATGVGITTIAGPVVPYLRAYNGQNGFKGQAAYGSIRVTRERAVNFNVPAARSVRVTVNGVVQSFPGPVNYINLPAGVGNFTPAPGIWWPAAVRYEFFSLAALGGVLLADVTNPRAWGGDTMGMV